MNAKYFLAIACGVFLLVIPAQGQVQFGFSPYIGVGGFTNGGSMQEYLDLRQETMPDLVSQDFRQPWGGMYGVAILLHYTFSERIAIQTGLQLKIQQNRLILTDKELTDIDSSYRASLTTAQLYVTALELPLMIRVNLPEWGRPDILPYVSGGMALERRLDKSVNISEEVVERNKTTGKTTKTLLDFNDNDLNGLPDDMLNLLLEGGVMFFGKESSATFVGLRWHYSLYAQELWSSKITNITGDQPEYSRVFEQEEQRSLRESEQIRMNDWRNMHLSLQLGILF